jgi:hypothetical protein
MSDQPKFCRDCKYGSEQVRVDGKDALCGHENAVMVGSDYEVTGAPEDRKFYSCVAMRAGICKEGKLWEPKDAHA